MSNLWRAVRLMAAAVITVATIMAAATPAQAHHGFTGRYDASQPLYLQGTVTAASYGYPHALITIDPTEAGPPPVDLRNLSEADYQRLGGRQVVSSAAPVRPTGEGTLTLLLPPPMTTTVADRADRPTVGANVGAVAYRECRTGELRVQLLRISAGERVVRTGVVQTEVDGCGPGSQQPDAPASSGTGSPTPTIALPTDQTMGDSGLPAGLWVALAATAVLGLGVVLPLLTRRRSSR
jgi:hypothetical protein